MRLLHLIRNSAIFCSFLFDYNYLCHIRATAKWNKELVRYEDIFVMAEYQGFELSEDVRLNVGNWFVPIKVEAA